MAKTTAPLLSFGAGGQIAKTQVYSTWKGRPYVRRYVVPANPQTAAQQLTRSAFAFLNALWKFYPAAATTAWALYADGFRITDRNAFLKANVSPLRAASDLTPMVISPAAKSGFMASAMVITPGSSQLSIAVTPPEIPAGWTIVKCHGLAIPDQDPNTGSDYALGYASDDTDPYTVVITGLTPAQLYLVGVWFEFTRPDGSPAFGQSLQDTETPTA